MDIYETTSYHHGLGRKEKVANMRQAQKKAITHGLNAYYINKSETCCGRLYYTVYSGGTLRDMGAEVFVTADGPDLIGGKNNVF
jgi:hypothetical protein